MEQPRGRCKWRRERGKEKKEKLSALNIFSPAKHSQVAVCRQTEKLQRRLSLIWSPFKAATLAPHEAFASFAAFSPRLKRARREMTSVLSCVRV